MATYYITNVSELQAVQSDLAGDYILTTNLNLSGINWTPLGTFTGTFDGGKYTISNLTINITSAPYQGLFSFLDGTGKSNRFVKDLRLTNVHIEGLNYVGGLAGNVKNYTISRCSVTGSVTGWDGATGGVNVGGLLGCQQLTSTTQDCWANVSVSGGWSVGGLIGCSFGNAGTCKIYSSYSVGSAYATPTRDNHFGPNFVHGVGGLVGTRRYDFEQNNFSVVTVTSDIPLPDANRFAGGYIGYGVTSEGVHSPLYYTCNLQYVTGFATYEPLGESAFYGSSHDVYVTGLYAWDFSTVWMAHPNGFPTFIPTLNIKKISKVAFASCKDFMNYNEPRASAWNRVESVYVYR